ncbi:MAG: 23S rRNA (adenine(2503)-C(2))-methyltransferase RlmN [Gammaproteobacteria bacterium]|nr:23S rRNA (adenine(2503)-C(2))-methyltransferase RlmN [Gammaproteobacteria bacterium]
MAEPAISTEVDTRLNLLGLDQAALRSLFTEMGDKPFRVTQLMKWMYHSHIDQFDDMSNFGLRLRQTLNETAKIQGLGTQFEGISADGTIKWLFVLEGGNAIETVFIPDKERGTLCVSTQVGCALDCSFCATARQGFNRNLTTAEIIGQLWTASERLRALYPNAERRITNVVIMGMGEPLANYANLVPALNLMVDDLAYGLSKRRVTVSTSGIVPKIDALKADCDVALAVSLHAPNDELRDELVPINKKYPIAQLMDACERWVQRDRKTHVMFEYVMLNEVNDHPEQARQLAKLLKKLPCKLNLIPFNPFEGSGYTVSPQKRIDRFWEILTEAGIRTTMRRTRGDDIDAACGQLAGKVEDKSRRSRKFEQPRFGEQK